MILPKFARNGTVIPVGPERPVLDGYGVPFDPGAHALYVLSAKGDESFVSPEPPADLFIYETPKDRPAGHWDKGYDKGNR